MSLPRLAGPQVALVPVSLDVARAVVSGAGLDAALEAAGLRAGRGWPHADTTDALRPLAEQGAEGGDGGWLICLDGEIVGDCGWRGGPHADGDVVLGYGLGAPFRGQGLGTEAVAVLAAWAEHQPGVQRLVAEVRVENVPSRRLLRRLGFVEEVDGPQWVRCVRVPGERPRIRGRHVC